MISNESKFYASFGVSFLIGLYIIYKYLNFVTSHVKYSLYIIYGLYLLASLYFYFKLSSPSKVFVAELVLSLVFVVLFSEFMMSYATSLSQPPVLDDNWWNALNWIRNNTPECAVIATYWDPGHFITGIAQRPVVFDGATQNTKLIETINGTRIVRSRIQDIATVLYTSNETEALNILKYYKMPNCSSMYFIASSDLIGKSHWWVYFSTWSPKTHSGDKNPMDNYYYAPLTAKKPMMNGNGTEYIYGNLFMVVTDGVHATPYLIQGNGQYVSKMSEIVYFYNNTPLMFRFDNASFDGMLYVTPGMRYAFYIPKKLENSLFTRMYFFNGYGLKHFKLVKNFGGEVKLFKVVFNETE